MFMNNRKFRMLVSVILALVMAVSTVVFAASQEDAASQQASSAQETALRMLGMLGAVQDYQSLDINGRLTKAYAAEYLVRAIGVTDAMLPQDVKVSYFSDVTEFHWAAPYINYMVENNMISTNTDMFYPESEANFEETLQLLVGLLGYENRYKGMEHVNYISAGQELGLLRGIPSDALNGPMTYGTFSMLLLNALNTDVMECIQYGATERYVVRKDYTLMNKYLSMRKISGLVTATADTSVKGGELANKDSVLIEMSNGDTKMLRVGDSGINTLLGYNCDLYYRFEDADSDSESDTVIFATKNTKNSELLVLSDEISGATRSQILYARKNDQRVRKANLEDEAVVVYNGAYFGRAFQVDPQKYQVEAGSLTLVDNDSDSKYDVVFIVESRNVVVKSVNVNTKKVIGKYGVRSVDFDEKETDVSYDLTKDGYPITLDEIKEWDVLSVGENIEGGRMVITVTDSTVEGTIVSKTDDEIELEIAEVNEAGETVKTENRFIEVSADYRQALEEGKADAVELNIGDQIRAHLDMGGRVAGVELLLSADQNRKYGFIINAKKPSGLGNAILQYLTDTSSIVTGELADMVTLDGVRRPQSEALDALYEDGMQVKRQLMIYETNGEGKITYIDTVTTNPNPNEKQLSLDRVAATRMLLNGENFALGYLINNDLSVGEFRVTADTPIFTYPPESMRDQLEYYRADKRGSLVGGQKFEVAGYDLNERGYAGAATICDSALAGSYADLTRQHLMLIDRISIGINANDEQVYKITGLYMGQETTITLAPMEKPADVQIRFVRDYLPSNIDESELTEPGDITINDLHRGDLIYFAENSAKEVNNIEKVFPLTKETTAETIKNHPQYIYNRRAYQERAFGDVAFKDENMFGVNVSNAGKSGMMTYTPAGYYYICDLVTGRVTLGSADDVKDIESFGEEEASKMFVTAWLLGVRANVIYITE